MSRIKEGGRLTRTRVDSGPGLAAAGRRREWLPADPASWAIVAVTVLALAIRLAALLQGGFLTGVTEYDDGPYFGSAVRLTQGVLPYRDFVFVQPPGITLLMLPSALFAKLAGTAWGLASGRILTVLAGTAGVALTGLLVRHRGVFATLVAGGLMAVYPDGVAASHTVLVEGWLVLFCLIGLVAVFEKERLTASPRRLAWGGAAFGFAGAVEAWAIVPVLILVVLLLAGAPPARDRARRAGRFVAGVAAGFLIPVIPFAAASPGGFYRSLITAQIGGRAGAQRAGTLTRLNHLAGTADMSFPQRLSLFSGHLTIDRTPVIITAVIIWVLLVMALPAYLIFARNSAPSPLAAFALAATDLVTAMFLWPPQFHYHFAAFLGPFLALAVALPLSRLVSGPGTERQPSPAPGEPPAGHWAWIRANFAVFVTGALIAGLAIAQNSYDMRLNVEVAPALIARLDQLAPPGACVISDSAALLLLANRFDSSVPGCTVVDDGLGTDLALSGGLNPRRGAASVPAVAALWQKSFSAAQFVVLTTKFRRRIAASTGTWAYFRHNFRRVYTDTRGDAVYALAVTQR